MALPLDARSPNPVVQQAADNPAWWQLPIVWMVIGGPALVVVAGFITLGIAIRYPDPIIKAPVASQADVPAVQARNHAATPQR